MLTPRALSISDQRMMQPVPRKGKYNSNETCINAKTLENCPRSFTEKHSFFLSSTRGWLLNYKVFVEAGILRRSVTTFSMASFEKSTRKRMVRDTSSGVSFEVEW